MKIRQSHQDDIHQIMTLIHQAQDYFKNAGIDQWQNGYPLVEHILEDIQKKHSYVLETHQIIGTMYFAIEDDPNYKEIDGEWKTQQQPYAVIHRIVVDKNYKGQNYARYLLKYAIDQCLKNHIQSIRIDTHEDNLSMQQFLIKNGFIKCGKITLESGAPRIGFEKIIE